MLIRFDLNFSYQDQCYQDPEIKILVYSFHVMMFCLDSLNYTIMAIIILPPKYSNALLLADI